MKKKYFFIITVIFGCFFFQCKKDYDDNSNFTYDDGAYFSLRSKTKRLCHKWKLKAILSGDYTEIADNQYLIFTNDKLNDGYLKVKLENFKDEFCEINPDTSGERYFNTTGKWKFYEGVFSGGCNIGERLSAKEGISMKIEDPDYNTKEKIYKIIRLSNKDLVIKYDSGCEWNRCHYNGERILYFSKA